MNEKETMLNYGNVRIKPNEDGSVAFLINGELDHHSVKEIRAIIDQTLIDYRPMSVILDLNEVSFTDSAGLGLILGRYTRINDYGGTMRLIGVSNEFMKILNLAGTNKFISAELRKKDK